MAAFLKFVGCFVLVGASVAALGQSDPATAVQAGSQTVDTMSAADKVRVGRIVAGVMEQRLMPSSSIAVVQGGKLAYTHAYGLAHLDPVVLATPEMRYSIGSVSKQFTAAAILLLEEKGKLSIDDAVGKYVPGLTRGNEVTIRQILSHTSGYQDYWPEDYLMTPMMKPATAQQILNDWAKKPLDFDPGTQWQYSNTNYVIAGLIVEKVSGQKLMDFLVEHIFRPLGMKSVWDSDEAKLTETDATAYIRAALGPLRPAPKEGRGWMFAAGELAMTPHDLALWDESMIARSVLSADSYKEMFTEVKLKDGKSSHYGLGVFVRDVNGHRMIEHSGEVTGFVSENDCDARRWCCRGGAYQPHGKRREPDRAADQFGAHGHRERERSRKAGAGDVSRIATRTNRSHTAGSKSQRLLLGPVCCRFSRQPGTAGRSVVAAARGGRAARWHDIPVIRYRLPDEAFAVDDLHVSRWKAGAVSGGAGGLKATAHSDEKSRSRWVCVY